MTELPKEIQEALLKRSGLDTAQQDISVSLDEINSFGDDESLKEMYQDIAAYRRMLQEKITFINPELSALVPFSRENLYLLCATSGTGKSTTAANISYPLWQQQKKVLIVTNEESKHDVLYRIACLHLGLSFNQFKKGEMPKANIKQVMELFKDIAKYVKVADVNFKDGVTSTTEGIKNLLNAVRTADFSCVLIDYWQNIKRTIHGDNSSHYNILDDLRIFLGQYIKKSNVPIVMFAQIYPAAGKRSTELEDRIKMGKTIYETATVVMEIITDFDNKVTKFNIRKDRFGYEGQYLNCYFDNGRYRAIDEDELKDIMQNGHMDNIAGKLDMEEDDTYELPEED
jgi:archaellum biogenesis ATPase FlaH